MKASQAVKDYCFVNQRSVCQYGTEVWGSSVLKFLSTSPSTSARSWNRTPSCKSRVYRQAQDRQ